MATYYIDYNAANDSANGTSTGTPWKRCPGMAGFAGSYSHSNGDIFIFKGGVTWPAACLSLTIANGGASGAVDTYTTDHSWYVGGAWSQPVFDGEGNHDKLILATLTDYIKIDDIKLIGAGVDTASNSYYAIDIVKCSHVEISRMSIAASTWIGIMCENTAGATETDIAIHHNDIVDSGMAIVVSNAADNAIITDVRIYNNDIHDLAPRLKYGVHGDGIHLWGSQAGASIQNIQIYSNRFYGDWEYTDPSTGTTAFIYLEDKCIDSQIYNNVGSYTNDPVPDGHVGRFIYCKGPGSGSGGHKILNNTFRGTIPGQWEGIEITGNTSCTIKNNIIECKKCYNIASSATGTLVIDYNDAFYQPAYNRVGTLGGSEKTWAQWQGFGFDANSITSDPLFTSEPNDLSLTTSSPCLNAGTTCSEFSTDFSGVTRTGTWDIGAFEGSSSGGTSTPVSTHLHYRYRASCRGAFLGSYGGI